MKRLLTFAAALCAVASLSLMPAEAGGKGGGTVSYELFFGDELPAAPFPLERVEIALHPASQVFLTPIYFGPEVGDQYDVEWDMDARGQFGFEGLGSDPSRVLVEARVLCAGGSAGTAWSPEDANGFEMRFAGWEDEAVALTGPNLLRRFQGGAGQTVPVEWWADVQWAGNYALAYNLLDVGVIVTYYPATR